MKCLLRLSVLLLLSTLGSVGAGAQNFTNDVTITSTDPDLILWDTDGKIWYIESDASNFSVAQGAGDTEVFIIEDSAPEGAFYMDSDGRVGIGTSAPVTDLEIFDPNGSETASLGLTVASGDSWTIGYCPPIYASCTTLGDQSGLRFFAGSLPTDPVPLRIKDDALDGAVLIDANGVRISGAVVQLSSRSRKTAVEEVDPAVVLERVLELPISRWSYRTDPPGVRHLGPMAEDFHSAFELGVDDQGISTLDASGVALAAIQGLQAEHERQVSELAAAHEAEIGALRARMAELERLVAKLAETAPDRETGG